MTVPAAPARVLVVDDDPKLVALLGRGLAFEGFDVVTAPDGAAALELLGTEPRPQLVLLDVAMPDMDGFEVCRRLRTTDEVPVIMVTARDDVRDTVTGLGLGADDYICKPFAFEELLARIGAVLRRRGNASTPLDYADLRVDPATREVHRDDRAVALTPTEFALLLVFLRNPRRVLSRRALVEAVWGADMAEPGCLDVHIGHLRRKLEAAGESRLIVTVRGVGFALRG